MKRIVIVTVFAMSLLTACVVVPRHGVAPFLPPVVVLDSEPYYFHDGYHYHYDHDRWYWSQSRKGPWYDLPRDHYPRELRFKGRHWGHDRDDRDYDDRDRH